MQKHLLELELTNTCNARCVMCPVVDMKRRRGFMSRRTLELNVEKGLDYGIQTIRFCGLGEPLLHKDFRDFFSYVKSRQLSVELITNGSFLNKEIVGFLIANDINTLSISFPSLIKENYEQIMKGLKHEDVLENVLFAIREVKKASTAFVAVTCAITGTNEEEQEHLRHFLAQEGVDHIQLYTPHNRGGHLKNKEVLDFSARHQEDPPGEMRRSLCAWPLRQFFVGWDGSVYLCCCDLEGEHNLGSVHTHDFADMERTQESILLMQPDLCKRCTYQRAQRIPQ